VITAAVCGHNDAVELETRTEVSYAKSVLATGRVPLSGEIRNGVLRGLVCTIPPFMILLSLLRASSLEQATHERNLTGVCTTFRDVQSIRRSRASQKEFF
jgi:hypothetical protein